jgi:hypothetical protein
MKVIYMECTLRLMMDGFHHEVLQLEKIGELKQTEHTRYLLIQETDGETGSNGEN